MIIWRTPMTRLAELLLCVIVIAIAVALMLFPLWAKASAAFDLRATFDAPASGGPVTGYRLYKGCDAPASKALVGEVTSGQALSGAVGAGVHHFCVAAYNGAGEGPVSEVARVEIGQAVPGAVRNLRIEVPCDGACTVTVTVLPAD